ncbi:GrpB family protein [Caldichromatium japonicum]|uniref:GrpB family protein n=1 Tax=Caldichromatium japonicum TaxID=2699430 RepID=A0A6G7VDH9_9GAMM|nr:GrpB family protein [Caldichromatium japonicum]QIK37960.1 GrpB family protein [Caldichromatium japonicum]
MRRLLDDHEEHTHIPARRGESAMKVVLLPYQPRWQDDFARHRQAIEKALSGLVPVVEHIGSTSLGDIAAKPIIDILIGLPEEQSLDAVARPLLDAGYTYIRQVRSKTAPPNDRPG